MKNTRFAVGLILVTLSAFAAPPRGVVERPKENITEPPPADYSRSPDEDAKRAACLEVLKDCKTVASEDLIKAIERFERSHTAPRAPKGKSGQKSLGDHF